MNATCIRIEGGLLSPDFLERIHELDGQKPKDFEARRSLVDEIASVWTDVQTYWKAFERRRAHTSTAESITTITREAWVIPLLEALGYQLTFQRRAAEIDGRSFPISHRATIENQPSKIENELDAPPVHIVGYDLELGNRPPSGRGTMSPHGLVQDYLNRSEHLWGIVTNGFTMRLLRDSVYLTRPAYIEFDLKQMLEGGRLDEFILFYRLAHRTRLPKGIDDADHCWLERYHQAALEQGGRIREGLRVAVEHALVTLANGFLAHPKNEPLRDKIRQGKLTAREFYRQLLYLIYRLLFLLVAEERNILLANHPVPPSSNSFDAARFYHDNLSIARLRGLAEEPLTAPERFDDLYLGLRMLFYILSDEKSAAQLALPTLNGELFNPLDDLDNAMLSNRVLLEAIAKISYFEPEGEHIRRRVNYAALDVEELGSVYESLLEFQPVFVVDGEQSPLTTRHSPLTTHSLQFAFAQGTERKSTGSYYTAPQLVGELIQSALVPVLQERLAHARRLANGEWRTAEEKDYAYSIVSRSGGVAARDASRQTGVPVDPTIPAAGTVRDDLPDAPSRKFDPSEHRRGLGTTLSGGIHPISPQGERQSDGTGNPPDAGSRSGILYSSADRATDAGGGNFGQTTPQSGAESAKAESKRRIASGEGPAETTRHSPLTIRWDSIPFVTRYSLLAREAILSIKVCDPACGSGHFLLAAARTLGKELGKVETQSDEPSPEAIRIATREIITHCIYGVDKNPLAVDLCKVALWLEGHAEGKPLTFLNHRILCGDSLVGVRDLSVLQEGIPDEAFDAVAGDDKKIAAGLKKQNRREREGQMSLSFDATREIDSLFAIRQSLLDTPDETPAQIRRKKAMYEKLREQGARDQIACHLWTAAFFAELTSANLNDNRIPTTDALRNYLRRSSVDERLTSAAIALAEKQRFFHWALEFPEVFGNRESGGSGFDVVLCNPPWERIKLQEQEFFATRDAAIANAPNKAARERLIKQLPARRPDLWREYQQALHDADATSKFLRQSERFPLTARGDINTYSVFAELFAHLINPSGRVGAVIPTGIATDDTNKQFFADLVETGRLASLYDFENREKLFSAVDSRYKFCLLTLRGGANGERRMVNGDHSPLATLHLPAEFVFFATRVEHLRDEHRRFTLTAEDFRRFNPNTRTCPVFRTKADAELTRKIYERVPVLVNEATGENPWGVRFLRMIDMANDSHLFRTRGQLESEGYVLRGNCFVKAENGERRMVSPDVSGFATRYLPLYEAKMIWHFDHRFGSYADVGDRNSTHLPTPTSRQYANPEFVIQPWYWVSADQVQARLEQRDREGNVIWEWTRDWLLGFRNVTNATNERTAIFSLLPRVAVGNSTPLLLTMVENGVDVASLTANLTSIVFDWVARQKLAGVNMNFFYVQQFPILPPAAYTPADIEFIVPRVLELVYTAWDIKTFADDVWKEAVNSEQRIANGEQLPLAARHSPLAIAIQRQWEANRAATGGHASDHSPLATHHSLPPFKWDEERRAHLRAELDAYYARLYGLTRDELRYILDPKDVYGDDFPGETFRVLKEKEMRAYGEYRTRRLVLEKWDQMQG